jgi:hypothetical protein
MADEFETRRGDDADTGSFGIGDLFSKVMSEGLPANVRAYLETAVRHNLDLPNPKFGNDFFTEKQLERLREIIENRTSDEIAFGDYPPGNLEAPYKTYEGPFAQTLGIGSLLQDIYNDEMVIGTSLGGFQVREDDENYYISDPFDFVGVPMNLLESIEDASGDRDFAYGVLRGLAVNMSPESYPNVKPPPVFELTIPKEGPIPRGPVPTGGPVPRMEESPTTEDMVAVRKKSAGGFVDKPLYERAL